MQTEFEAQELRQYLRHLPLAQVGLVGQKTLKAARVLVIGAGGLGSPVLMYLAAAGVGEIGIVDHDAVDVTNLQRQVIFTHEDVGNNKAQVAGAFLKARNPYININTYPMAFELDNGQAMVKSYDYILDCTDNAKAKYLINDICAYAGKPLIFASIGEFQGLCASFKAPETPCYRCLFPEPPPQGLVKNCAEGGVLGTTAGLLGLIQANEVIRQILATEDNLYHKLLCVDVLTLKFEQFKTQKNSQCLICAKKTLLHAICYEAPTCKTTEDAYALSPELLTQHKVKYTLVDVRTQAERAVFHLGGLHMPLNELEESYHTLPKEKPLLLYCQAGARSEKALQLLLQKGFSQLKHLKGGINGFLQAGL